MPGWVGLLPWLAAGLQTLPEHLDAQGRPLKSSHAAGRSGSSALLLAGTRPTSALDGHQALLSVPFLGLGAWCLFWPHSVERLCLRKKYRHESVTSGLLMSCFGSQAMLFGLAMLTVEPTREFYGCLAAALTPYFAFNYWGLYGEGRRIFTEFLWLDAIGNCILLAVAGSGYLKLR